jgi:long-chain acyl-CoA synthetase
MTMPSTARSLALPRLLRASADRFSDHSAILDGNSGRPVDFATFRERSQRVAVGLTVRGIGKGDRVALYCINSAEFAISYFGILMTGATVVPINVLLNPKEIAYILDDAGARALFYHQALERGVDAVRGLVPSLELCVGAGDGPGRSADLLWEDLIAAPGEPPDPPIEPREDVAAILYTSGTTGQPKGVMLTHHNLASNVASAARGLQLEPGHDVILVVLPMFHSFAATVGMLTPLLNGLTFVPLPRFEPGLVAEGIARSKATVFLGVPSMYNLLLRLPAGAEAMLAGLRFCVCGGAALPGEILEQFEERFGIPVYEGDGPTECSPVTCVNPIGGTRKPGSVGLPIPDVEMRILDEEGRELARGEVGEICVRGPNVMKGYWMRPTETAESFFADWFRTGDLGYQDSEGYFYIVDRKKDMIIVNGMNVYPRVVEDVLHRHPAVAEAAVIGEPHGLHGEIPVAFVAVREGYQASAAEIRAFCRENLGRHEVPRRVAFMGELPKTATGKVLKRELRRHGERERGIDTPAQ